MNRLARGLIWKGGAITVVLLLLLIVLWANLNSMITENCVNRIISEVSSPDGETKAVIFQRECGLDSPPSTQVSLLPASEPLPNRKGNLFIAEDQARRAGVSVAWTSPVTIDLSYKTRHRIVYQSSNLMGVTISYPTAVAAPRKKVK